MPRRRDQICLTADDTGLLKRVDVEKAATTQIWGVQAAGGGVERACWAPGGAAGVGLQDGTVRFWDAAGSGAAPLCEFTAHASAGLGTAGLGSPPPAATFRDHLEAAFLGRSSDDPFLVVAVRMEPSQPEAAHFNAVGEGLRASIRPTDHVLIDEEGELVLIDLGRARRRFAADILRRRERMARHEPRHGETEPWEAPL